MTGGRPPTLTVIAGPNGSGKSTFTAAIHTDTLIPLVDPDAIARSLHSATPEQAAIRAGREAVIRQMRYLEAGISFAVETTLAGSAMLRRMERARQHGFIIHLIFIATDNVQTNIDRIAQRVAQGGHNVLKQDVRRRYARSMDNLAAAIQRADRTTIIDNSADVGPREVLAIDMGRITTQAQEMPAWVTTHLASLIAQLDHH